MPKLTIHDFRITDRVLAETDPDAGDIVYVPPGGGTPFPFVVWRKVAGPSGVYVDSWEVLEPGGQTIASGERKFELEGESVVQDLVDEVRRVRFGAPGEHTLRYWVYDDRLADIPFQVSDEDPPFGVIVPGPLDAALSKSTICWVTVPPAAATRKAEPVTKPVWYGYAGGRIYVLVGPKEQDVPGLAATSHATVIARSKDKLNRVAETECIVRVLPKDARWDDLARDVMIGRRLNLVDGEAALDRWRQTCEVVELTPLPPPLQA